ncbi:DUF3108 domain-containing protein [Nevskia sp.]|uniref:DUF3108 domain-containing protein n=1 Tax=Nevskia sp. TaxID=1929292 RepID=UPI0025EBAEC4|nr:DUF3108 domain-containing protein [Nevskia sp.]
MNTKKTLLAGLLAAMIGMAGSVQAAAVVDAPLPALNLVYSVNYGGIGAGEADVSLKPDAKAGCYIYETKTRPVGFIKMLFGSPNQVSRFCVEGGVVRSQRFESVLEKDEEQSYVLDFDYAKRQVIDENGVVREIPSEAVDSFALQQAVRLWVAKHAADATPPIAEFTMVDRKNLTHYQLKLAGRETIKTPAGNFDTIRLERIDNPDKIGRFWLAAERDWMPVKIQTKSGNKPTAVLTLKR